MSYTSFYPSYVIATVRDDLFVNGLSASQIEAQTGINQMEIHDILRTHVLDASRATTAKELRVYKFITIDGFAPSQIARRLKTGEEEIRHILLTLERPGADASEDETDESSSDESSESASSTSSDSSDSSSDHSEESSEYGRDAKRVVNFFFAHSVKENDDEDITDKMAITKVDGNYKIETSYGYNSESREYDTRSIHYEYTMRGLLQYCRFNLKMAAADKNAYESVEFQIPSCISFTMRPKDIEASVPKILKGISATFLEEDIIIPKKNRVCIYFTRNETDAEERIEDLLTIAQEDNAYKITMTYSRSHNNGTNDGVETRYVYTIHDVLKFCQLNLKMAAFDQKPYSEIEVHLPTCVAFSVTPDMLRKRIPQILNGISFAFLEQEA